MQLITTRDSDKRIPSGDHRNPNRLISSTPMWRDLLASAILKALSLSNQTFDAKIENPIVRKPRKHCYAD